MAGDWWLRDVSPLYRHFERSEKSLSFAVRRSMFGTPKQETCSPQTFGHRPIHTSRRFYIFMRRTTISHF